MKKGRYILIVLLLGFFLMLGNFVRSQGDSATGVVGFAIIDPNPRITIDHPENTTYNYLYYDNGEYPIDLNVSANFVASNWQYVLTDPDCNDISSGYRGFTPNITILASRRSNILDVYADDNEGEEYNANVTFVINVSNHAPTLSIEEEYLFCEDSSGSYSFNATDIDEDHLNFAFNPGETGAPFYIHDNPLSENFTCGIKVVAYNRIFSENLFESSLGGEKGWRTHVRNISVRDNGSPEYSDRNQTNLTIIEVNDLPYLEDLPSFMVWTFSDNSTFERQVFADDEESGDQFSENLSFNLTFLNGVKFFDINASGFMNFTGNESMLEPGNMTTIYNITLCVTDRALGRIHPGVGFCKNPDGSDHTGLNNTVCDWFQMIITKRNRPPTIWPYYPIELNFTASGTTPLYFNITKYDPDGSIPFADWYVDGVFMERDEGSNVDNFTYSFPCGVGGLHKVKVIANDSELTDFVQWNVTVEGAACPQGGGGGGGGGLPVCAPLWGCIDWNVCQNAEQSLEAGVLTGMDYRAARDGCAKNYWDETACGFQIRSCTDVKLCNKAIDKPAEIQSCFFSINPNCRDGIKNCHDGGCEFLIDCGGPCGACATCSDGKQNQGEAGIDCGGPCPFRCPAELPRPNSLGKMFIYLFQHKSLIYGLIVIIILLVILVVRLRRIYRLKREIGDSISE